MSNEQSRKRKECCPEKELGITGNKKELLTSCGILKQNKQKEKKNQKRI